MKATKKWFVVASKKEARIFTQDQKSKRLQLFVRLSNPLAQEKRSSLVRKKAGHGLKLFGRHGVVRYSDNKRSDPLEIAALQFAKEVVHFLEIERLKKSFDSLTIVAEPHFLGKIKNSMPEPLKREVSQWMGKDLQKTMLVELPKFLLGSKKADMPSVKRAG